MHLVGGRLPPGPDIEDSPPSCRWCPAGANERVDDIVDIHVVTGGCPVPPEHGDRSAAEHPAAEDGDHPPASPPRGFCRGP